MSAHDVVQSHVEVLMRQVLAIDDLYVEPGGQVPVHYRSAVYRVRVLPYGSHPHVEVFSVMVADVDADPGLYEALNDMNRRLVHARAYWNDRKVILAAELFGSSIDVDELGCTCDEIANVANIQGPRIAKTFGGHVARPDEVDEENL